MNARIFDDPEALSRAAARTIVQRAAGLPQAAIGLSGGSTPKRTYELLAGRLDRIAVTWVVVDERHVPEGHPRSNVSMMLATLFPGGLPEAHRFIRFRTELAPDDAARDFEDQWRAAGLERLDLVVLGCGDDGHTASLFPEVDVPDEGVARAVFVPKLEEWRMTLTMGVLRAAAFRMVLATGPSKAPIVRGVREGARYPVALATEGEGETWWFLDRAAAGD